MKIQVATKVAALALFTDPRETETPEPTTRSQNPETPKPETPNKTVETGKHHPPCERPDQVRFVCCQLFPAAFQFLGFGFWFRIPRALVCRQLFPAVFRFPVFGFGLLVTGTKSSSLPSLILRGFPVSIFGVRSLGYGYQRHLSAVNHFPSFSGFQFSVSGS